MGLRSNLGVIVGFGSVRGFGFGRVRVWTWKKWICGEGDAIAG